MSFNIHTYINIIKQYILFYISYIISIFKKIPTSYLYTLYIKYINYINLILIVLIILLYSRKNLNILNYLPISIYKNNKRIYESNSVKTMSNNDNLYSITENEFQYLIYVSDKNNLLYQLNDYISIMIYNTQGEILFTSDLFKKNMYMIHTFNIIENFIHELKLNTITEIEWNKLNPYDINRTLIFQYKNIMFGLSFFKKDDLYIIRYDLQNVSNHDMVFLINNIKDIYSFNHVIEISNNTIVNSNNNLINNNISIENAKNIYNKYNDFITYKVYQDQNLMVANLQLNTLLSIFKKLLNEKLLSILSIITNAFNGAKNTDDIALTTNKKISSILMYIQNSLQQIIFMNSICKYEKFNIYTLINPLLHNLKLTFGNIVNINIGVLFDVIINFSTDLIEYLITHAYILAYINNTSMIINIEKNLTNIMFTITYSSTTITLNNFNNNLLRLEYILKINNIETEIFNNGIKFKISII